MRMLWVLVIAGFISGCMSTGGITPEQTAALKSLADENKALVAAHKITHVEAADKYNSAIEQMAAGRLTQDDRLLMSYRVALASEEDSGKITAAEADYNFQQRRADIVAQEQQQRTNNSLAAAAIIGSMPRPQPYVLPQPQIYAPVVAPRAPFNCTSMPMGNSIYTSCN